RLVAREQAPPEIFVFPGQRDGPQGHRAELCERAGYALSDRVRRRTTKQAGALLIVASQQVRGVIRRLVLEGDVQRESVFCADPAAGADGLPHRARLALDDAQLDLPGEDEPKLLVQERQRSVLLLLGLQE